MISIRSRMWADAKRDGRPAEHRWRTLRKFRNSIPCTTQKSLADARCWPECRAVMLPIYENARLRRSEFCTWENSVRGAKAAKKCIYSVPAQDMAKDRAKFGCPMVSDVAAVMKS